MTVLRAMNWTAKAFAGGIVIALLIVMFGEQSLSPRAGIIFGLMAGVAIGMVIGFAGGVDAEDRYDLKRGVNYRRGRAGR